MIKKYLALVIIVFSTLLCWNHSAYASISFTHRRDVNAFIIDMARKHHFSLAYLKRLFSAVQPQPSVLKILDQPYEAQPWFEYRQHFLTPARIDGGVKFWRQYKTTLARAEKKYGVPAEIIVAIIGVESLYGKHTGQFRVLDVLSTIAFEYPKRQEFFRSQLEEFLLLCREYHLNPTKVMGSYAGAIGWPQFMPSSFRKYAVDFSGNGKISLTHDAHDVIGSVANYLHAYGWNKDQKVAIKATWEKRHTPSTLQYPDSMNFTAVQLRKIGIAPSSPLTNGASVKIIKLQDKKGDEYWLGLDNIYVITHYNTSMLYAMAVYELGQAIKEKMHPASKPTHRKPKH